MGRAGGEVSKRFDGQVIKLKENSSPSDYCHIGDYLLRGNDGVISDRDHGGFYFRQERIEQGTIQVFGLVSELLVTPAIWAQSLMSSTRADINTSTHVPGSANCVRSTNHSFFFSFLF